MKTTIVHGNYVAYYNKDRKCYYVFNNGSVSFSYVYSIIMIAKETITYRDMLLLNNDEYLQIHSLIKQCQFQF